MYFESPSKCTEISCMHSRNINRSPYIATPCGSGFWYQHIIRTPASMNQRFFVVPLKRFYSPFQRCLLVRLHVKETHSTITCLYKAYEFDRKKLTEHLL